MPPENVDVGKLARSYRRLVLWFGAQLLVNCGSFGLHALPGDSIAGAIAALAFAAAALATIVALAYYGFHTASALGSPAPWLWAVAMFVPCANVISLLVLSSKATRACAARGIPVGLLGPKVVPDPPRATPGAG